MESLRLRLIAGEAGQMEIVLYRYAYGTPRDPPAEADHESRFQEMRAAVWERLASEDRDGLHVLNALVVGISLKDALRSVGLSVGSGGPAK